MVLFKTQDHDFPFNNLYKCIYKSLTNIYNREFLRKWFWFFQGVWKGEIGLKRVKAASDIINEEIIKLTLALGISGTKFAYKWTSSKKY